MLIPEKHFLKFKKLMRETVGEEAYNKMTEQELLASAIALITLVKAVYKPITKEEHERFNKRNTEKKD